MFLTTQWIDMKICLYNKTGSLFNKEKIYKTDSGDWEYLLTRGIC